MQNSATLCTCHHLNGWSVHRPALIMMGLGHSHITHPRWLFECPAVPCLLPNAHMYATLLLLELCVKIVDIPSMDALPPPPPLTSFVLMPDTLLVRGRAPVALSFPDLSCQHSISGVHMSACVMRVRRAGTAVCGHERRISGNTVQRIAWHVFVAAANGACDVGTADLRTEKETQRTGRERYPAPPAPPPPPPNLHRCNHKKNRLIRHRLQTTACERPGGPWGQPKALGQRFVLLRLVVGDATGFGGVVIINCRVRPQSWHTVQEESRRPTQICALGNKQGTAGHSNSHRGCVICECPRPIIIKAGRCTLQPFR